MKKKRFGIEIEFTGVRRRLLALKLEETLKMKRDSRLYRYSNGDTDIDIILTDKYGKEWTLHRDRSICAESRHIMSSKDEYQVELISPVLTIQTLSQLLKILQIIREEGGIVNESCGIHIHVDNPGETYILQNMILVFGEQQEDIMEHFGVEKTRREKYCKMLPECLIERMKSKQYYSQKELQNDYIRILSDGTQEESHARHQSRYYAMNLHSLITNNTVEFRFFNSTLKDAEVCNAIYWTLGFTAFTAYTEIPKEISG